MFSRILKQKKTNNQRLEIYYQLNVAYKSTVNSTNENCQLNIAYKSTVNWTHENQLSTELMKTNCQLKHYIQLNCQLNQCRMEITEINQSKVVEIIVWCISWQFMWNLYVSNVGFYWVYIYDTGHSGHPLNVYNNIPISRWVIIVFNI